MKYLRLQCDMTKVSVIQINGKEIHKIGFSSRKMNLELHSKDKELTSSNIGPGRGQ